MQIALGFSLKFDVKCIIEDTAKKQPLMKKELLCMSMNMDFLMSKS